MCVIMCMILCARESMCVRACAFVCVCLSICLIVGVNSQLCMSIELYKKLLSLPESCGGRIPKVDVHEQ